jgi:hypothetical protein
MVEVGDLFSNITIYGVDSKHKNEVHKANHAAAPNSKDT